MCCTLFGVLSLLETALVTYLYHHAHRDAVVRWYRHRGCCYPRRPRLAREFTYREDAAVLGAVAEAPGFRVVSVQRPSSTSTRESTAEAQRCLR
eukprot:SAG11_NODE_1800_length_4243_cov_4.590734_6_plen_94_part_00